MLKETAVPVIGQPVLDELARHLRLPEGFGGDTSAELDRVLRAAMAHIETRLGLALIERNFVWHLAPDGAGAITAPVSPVSALLSVARVLPGGVKEPIDLAFWQVRRGADRSQFQCTAAIRSELEITFTAGFGADWTDIPADLRQAALMLAAHYFENRFAVGEQSEVLPLGISDLLRPWHPLRLTVGQAS